MKRINLFWIIWIFVTLEFKDVACVSYPGVDRNELPLIVPGASPIENVFVTERYGINYECIETCYPILNICDDKCNNMPDLPECLQCQRLNYGPRPPSFEHRVKPIVPYPSRLPRPPMIPKPIVPDANRPIFRHPPRPIIPHIPRPPEFEMFEPILPNIPQPPKLEIFEPDLPSQPILLPVPPPPVYDQREPDTPPQLIFYDTSSPSELEVETEIPTQPTVPEVPHRPVFEHFQPELPPKPILPDVPRPPPFKPVLPLQQILPKIPLSPELKPIIQPQPIIPELLRPPQFETELIPQPLLPDMQIYPQFQLLEPEFHQPMFPYVPLSPQFEQEFPSMPFTQYPTIDIFEPELQPLPMPEVPFITIYESPQVSVIQPIFPEIVNPGFVQIPSPPMQPHNVLYPEEAMLYIPEVQSIYDSEEAGLILHKGILQPPMIVNEYQDICNDYCLLKRNISECEICLKTGVPADHLELCSNCLINPSEPDCQLCSNPIAPFVIHNQF